MFNCKKIFSGLLLLWLGSQLLAAEAGLKVEHNELPIKVRTPEDIEQGKKNVQSVFEELAALFNSESAPAQLVEAAKAQDQPAYCKIIPAANNRSTIVFRPRFTTVKQMFRTLDSVISGQVYLESLAEQNLLVISVPNAEIEHYKKLMEAMDVKTPQLLIEAKVVELLFNDGMQRNFSFRWNNRHGGAGVSGDTPGQSSQPVNGLGTNWNFKSGQNNFNVSFQWLLTAQDARVLSSPNILITRNEISRIVTGSDIPIQEATTTTSTTSITTKFKRVGVSLEVEPTIINNDSVTLRIYPSVSNVTSYETIVNGSGAEASRYSVPVISIRNIEAHVRLHDRQTVMMGGLYSSATSLQQQRTPVLSDIPVIGELFTGKNYTKEVTQLVFFLKVYILNPVEGPGTVMTDPNNRAKVSEGLGKVMQALPTFPKHQKSLEALGKEFRQSLPGIANRSRENLNDRLEKQPQNAQPDKQVYPNPETPAKVEIQTVKKPTTSKAQAVK